jgi:acyl carrier protein phosphodiesterase
MNYLAHLFLSEKIEDILFGNLLEDFMHGRFEHPRNAHLSEGIKNGIRLHRRIDTLTDQHEIVKECKKLFYPDFGKYASVVVDVLFDHFLIINWNNLTEEPFVDFRLRVYKSLEKYRELMPDALDKLVSSMIYHDWLKAYETDEGLSKALSGLNKKIKSGPDMLLGIPIMHENYEYLDSRFKDFFGILQTYCHHYIISHP